MIDEVAIARRRREMSRRFPRIWIAELGRYLWVLGSFTGGAA
jgi:hypothetical protein